MNETLQTIKARRSVRAYTEQQVSAEDLNLILEAATYAPSGMHLETWHFTAIQNKEVYRYKFWQGACRGQVPAGTASS